MIECKEIDGEDVLEWLRKKEKSLSIKLISKDMGIYYSSLRFFMSNERIPKHHHLEKMVKWYNKFII